MSNPTSNLIRVVNGEKSQNISDARRAIMIAMNVELAHRIGVGWEQCYEGIGRWGGRDCILTMAQRIISLTIQAHFRVTDLSSPFDWSIRYLLAFGFILQPWDAGRCVSPFSPQVRSLCALWDAYTSQPLALQRAKSTSFFAGCRSRRRRLCGKEEPGRGQAEDTDFGTGLVKARIADAD
jgi:hypothetical protein